MKTLLITGGAGFIGGTLVRRLIRSGNYRVVNLDLLTYAGNLASLKEVEGSPNHHFVKGDIRDERLVAQLLDEYRPVGVIHLAAESHVDRSIGAPATFIETNVLGTQAMLEASRGYWNGLDAQQQQVFRFLHVSTDEVYGSLGATGKFTETTPYAPNSPYSASKASSDHLARAYFHTYGMPVLISNCSNNYGPYQFPEKLIPLMILNAIEGKPLPVYGDGSNVRDWLQVEDHCEALEAIFTKGRPGEVYNIGGDSERTNMQVVEAICHVVDELCPDLPHKPCKGLIQFVSDRPGHDHRYAIDATKIQQELGWKPAHEFEAGMRETVQWYLENREWVQQVTDGSYQRERLGLLEAAEKPTIEMQGAKPAESYVEGPIDGIEFRSVGKFTDDRGWLAELFRIDEMPPTNAPAMAYVSETKPRVVRGPHEHVDQTDNFVFVGPSDFEIWLWDSRPKSPTFGNFSRTVVGQSNPTAVSVPPGVVHAYRNLSAENRGWVFNAPNRLYAGENKKEEVDEIRHEGVEGTPYLVAEDD